MCDGLSQKGWKVLNTWVRRFRVGSVVIGIGALAGIMVGLTAAATTSPPGPPSAQALAQGGIVATPLNQVEVVSASQALQTAEIWYPQMSSVSVGGELVMFSDNETDGLATPQPAWLFTWYQVTDQPLYPKASSPQGSDGTPWTHMNVAVSAVTGKVLEGFTTP